MVGAGQERDNYTQCALFRFLDQFIASKGWMTMSKSVYVDIFSCLTPMHKDTGRCSRWQISGIESPFGGLDDATSRTDLDAVSTTIDRHVAPPQQDSKARMDRAIDYKKTACREHCLLQSHQSLSPVPSLESRVSIFWSAPRPLFCNLRCGAQRRPLESMTLSLRPSLRRLAQQRTKLGGLQPESFSHKSHWICFLCFLCFLLVILASSFSLFLPIVS